MANILEELRAMGAQPDDAIYRFMGDEEMYLGYVWGFLNEPTMGKLVEAVEREDYVEAKAQVHALKGITKNLGFTKLADAATDMNAEFVDQNIEDALEAYEDVKKQYKKYCDVIRSCQSF